MRDRELLLILDNCEHLVHACAELAKQLLQAGPRLKILASSRELLHVRGRDDLSGAARSPFPIRARRSAVEALLAIRSGAPVRRSRARRAAGVRGDGRRTRAAVADICQRLDGIPLAIELAAARVRSLSVEKIAERLTDRFRLLTRGRPHGAAAAADAARADRLELRPPRHAGEDAVRAACRSSRAAARWRRPKRWARAARSRAPDVLDLLAALVEKSLVELDAGGERYRMLETVRQYAQEKLDASGEADAARTRHLEFYPRARRTRRSRSSGARSRASGSRGSISSARTSSAAHAGATTRRTAPRTDCGSSSRCSSTGCRAD